MCKWKQQHEHGDCKKNDYKVRKKLYSEDLWKLSIAGTLEGIILEHYLASSMYAGKYDLHETRTKTKERRAEVNLKYKIKAYIW